MSNLLEWLGARPVIEFFAQGNPPVAVQLLIVNGIFFVLWLVQRARFDIATRQRSAKLLTCVLLASNFYILMHGDAAFR